MAKITIVANRGDWNRLHFVTEDLLTTMGCTDVYFTEHWKGEVKNIQIIAQEEDAEVAGIIHEVLCRTWSETILTIGQHFTKTGLEGQPHDQEDSFQAKLHRC